MAPYLESRLPYAPVERLLRARYDAPDWSHDIHDAPLGDRRGFTIEPGDRSDHGLWCDEAAALMLDVHRRQIVRWRSEGLTLKAADAVSAHLTLHPLEIWGRTWEVAEISQELRSGWHETKRSRRLWKWPDGRQEVA